MPERHDAWTASTSDEVHDVVVIGSGAGGLAAAVTARRHGLDVAVVERETAFGGTAAWSGGWMWIPANPGAARAGAVDDGASARIYLQHEIGDRAVADNIEAFLVNGPRMVAFFEQYTPLEFAPGVSIPDFHFGVPVFAVGRPLARAGPFSCRPI